MDFRDHFTDALKDYTYLMKRGYPARGSLKLVSDRYGLGGRERSMLYHGVFEPEAARKRKERLLAVLQQVEGMLIIDGFNVLVIVASYLQGLPVFVSNDGLLRDAAQNRKDHSTGPKIPEAAGLLSDYLLKIQTCEPVIYLDQQVPAHSSISAILTRSGLKDVRISDHADRDLSGHRQGVLCTSDTEIIHRSALPVFDLAYDILKRNFYPSIIDLQELIIK